MHTGGEPVRIVTSGYPAINGDTILEKRRHVAENLDHLRRLLMHEPRGHADMYGALLVEPDAPEADLAVLFMHNEGYSTMCGHATIALGRWAVETGLVPTLQPETMVTIQAPCGLLHTRVELVDGEVGTVRFTSVPAFVVALDHIVEVPGHGTVAVDIGYGGAFYAVLPAARIGLDLAAASVAQLAAAGAAVTESVRGTVHFPEVENDLGFVYGTILTDGGNGVEPSVNVCVFADHQIDRSPTGSGVTARLALQAARDEVAIGEPRRFQSLTGAVFTGTPVRRTQVGSTPSWLVEVGGESYFTGECRWTVEERDPLPSFLLR